MRSDTFKAEKEMYDCFECGARETDPEQSICSECGGELCHLGRPRDL